MLIALTLLLTVSYFLSLSKCNFGQFRLKERGVALKFVVEKSPAQGCTESFGLHCQEIPCV